MRPGLDGAFENSDTVFTARLISASISSDFTLYVELALESPVKGNPPEELTFSVSIDPLASCGPDWTVGKFYLVFLKTGQTTLSGATGTRLLGAEQGELEWVILKMQKWKAT